MLRVLYCVFAEHNLWLVGLAALICVLSIVGAVMALDRLDAAAANRRAAWLFLAALASGGGTWATHFVAMLAYDPGLTLEFDEVRTVASAIIGVFGAWAAFQIFVHLKTKWGRTVAGVILGGSVAALHYVGMSGVEAGAREAWAVDLVVASGLLSAAFAVLGLHVLDAAKGWRTKAGACALLVLGIVSLHFTGMGAVTFVPDSTMAPPAHILDRAGLALMVAAGAMVLLIAAFALALADRRLAETKLAAAARIQRLADATLEGLVMHDGKTVVDTNSRFAALLGRSVESLVGQPLAAFTTLDALASIAAAIVQQTDVLVETRLQGAEGPVDVEFHTRALGGGVYVSAVRDISMRKRAETAERENIAKSHFIANMSHELRTPLNAIIGYSEMIEEDSSDARAASDATHIRTAAQHLLSLINDILDLSRTESGRIEICLDDCDLPMLIHEACATVRPTAKANGDTIECEVDPAIQMVAADGLRLKQCLLNLLSNAAKFTENGNICVSAKLIGADWIDITVADTGIGMSRPQLDRVFEAYVQADGSISRKYGGTGLGLSITRRLARLMGGDVSVESEPGQGSTFTMRIPMRRVADNDGVAAAA